MTRLQQFQYEVNNITKNMIRNSFVEPKKLSVEVCWNLKEEMFVSSWSHHSVFSGLQKKFISELGMVKCKKSDAHILIIIGERPEYLQGAEAYGCWGKGVKNIWLKPIVN